MTFSIKIYQTKPQKTTKRPKVDQQIHNNKKLHIGPQKYVTQIGLLKKKNTLIKPHTTISHPIYLLLIFN